MGARRRWFDDDGFTLLELVIVTIIIAILATIAIAVFFTQREKAQRSSAISSARNTSTLAESIRLTVADDESTYTDDPQAYRQEGGTGFDFVPTESTGPRVVSIEAYSADGDDDPERGPIVVMAAQGGGRCYWIRHDTDGEPARGYFEMVDEDDCDASGSVPGGDDLWEAQGTGW